MKVQWVIAGLMVAAASPSTAAIVLYDTPGALQPDENVLFQIDNTPASTVFGTTNMTNTQVTFTSTESLSTPARGQARVTATDRGLSNLSFFLTDPTLGFKQVEFNIFGTRGTATGVNLSYFDFANNMLNSQFYAIGNGENFFSAEATGANEFIRSVTIELNGNVVDIRQFRIGGIGTGAVPEPGSWAMLIAGFGLVGAAMRRRQQAVA